MTSRRDARARLETTTPAARLTDEPDWTSPDDWREPGQNDARAYLNFLTARREWRSAHDLQPYPPTDAGG